MRNTFLRTSIFIAIFAFLSCGKESTPVDYKVNGNPEIVLVGTNKMLVSPPEGQGIKMSGYSGRTEPFESIHDNLFARSLVIEDQDDLTTTIHVSIDMLNIGSDVFYEVFQRVNQQIPNLNLPLANLFITATHTHGGPSVHTQQAAAYKLDRTQKIVQSIINAYQNKQPTRIRVGSIDALNVNRNRQNPHSSGQCALEVNPLGNSDKEAHFMEFINQQGQSIASMTTFGVHSTVMGLHNKKITGDLAGYASRHVENAKGNNHVSLFLYTGGGDQSPVVRTQDAPKIDDPVTGPKAFGDRLGSQLIAGFETGSYINDIRIKSDTMLLALQRDFQPKDDIPDTQEIRALYGIRYSPI